MNLKSAIFFIVLTFLLGCSPRAEKPLYIDGDDLIPPEPSLMSYFTIHGEDADHDGVRDDFEIYVNRRFKDPNIRRALKYDAKIFGDFMKATSAAEINRLFKEGIDAAVCSSFLYRSEVDLKSNEVVELRDRLYNNPWRIWHYNKQGRIVKGGVYSWGDSNVISSLKLCKIKFTDLHKTLQIYLKDDDYKHGQTLEDIKEFETLLNIKSDSKKNQIPLRGRKYRNVEDLEGKKENQEKEDRR